MYQNIQGNIQDEHHNPQELNVPEHQGEHPEEHPGVDSYQKDLNFPRVWSEFRLVIEMMSLSERFLKFLISFLSHYSSSSVH